MVDCYTISKRTKNAKITNLACDTAIKTHNLLKHMEDFKHMEECKEIKTGWCCFIFKTQKLLIFVGIDLVPSKDLRKPKKVCSYII